MRRLNPAPILLFLPLVLLSCGSQVPIIAEPWEADYKGVIPVSASGQLEFEIKKKVYCDLKHAIIDVDRLVRVTSANGGKLYQSLPLPNDWGAQISLTMETDESGSLNPGLAFITPFSNQTFRSIGLGASLGSTASRIDKFNPFYTVSYLRSPVSVRHICEASGDPYLLMGVSPANSSMLLGDLGIEQWLTDAVLFNELIPSVGTPGTPAAAPAVTSNPSAQTLSPSTSPKTPKKAADSGPSPKPDTISYEVKFVVVASGNITPQWKLVRVSANTGSSPFVSAGQTRTHDLIITIGPQNIDTSNQSLALQIGQAVSSANRAAGITSVPLP